MVKLEVILHPLAFLSSNPFYCNVHVSCRPIDSGCQSQHVHASAQYRVASGVLVMGSSWASQHEGASDVEGGRLELVIGGCHSMFACPDVLDHEAGLFHTWPIRFPCLPFFIFSQKTLVAWT